MILVGSVLPIAVDLATPGFSPAHTLFGTVLLLVVVMLATHGRRRLRRQLLGLSIGVFFHIVLDGTWMREELFWWPALGNEVGPPGFSAFDRPWGVLLAMELVGAAAIIWAYRRFELARPELRSEFVRTGHLDKALMGPGEPPTC